MLLPDMLYGATVRSQIPRGKIKKITFDPGIDWNEFVIASAKDIPGKNCIALIGDDQPCLADGIRESSRGAHSLVSPPGSPRSPKGGAMRSRSNTILFPRYSPLKKASAAPKSSGVRTTLSKLIALKRVMSIVYGQRADYIVEGEYTTGAQEQLYIENNGMIAAYDAQQGITVWGSLQCPYYVHKALMALCDLPAEKVRVVQMETGGAFGGKEDYPSMIAGHAALLAIKSGRPVKIVYDRAEDMAATTKRHPSRTRHRTAVSRDGKILGGEIEFTIDGGAYATLSSVVLSRGAIHAGGPYYWPNVRIRAKAVATNAPPHGAFRGFGAPQSYFRHGAAHGPDRAGRWAFAGRDPAPEFPASPDKRRPRNRRSKSRLILKSFLTALSAFLSITRRKSDSRSRISPGPQRKESASRLSCTVRDLPARVSAI